MPRLTRPARRSAFTLVELVLASALAVVVLLGLQSAVMIASRAIPAGAPAADLQATSSGLDRLSLDLGAAKRITAIAADRVEFTVADHDGDAADDTITYSWSGNDGDGLERRLDGNKAEAVIPSLNNFSIALTTESVAAQRGYVESNETLLASYTDASNSSPWGISDSSWLCQEVPYSLPGDAVDFRTTRVRFNVGAAGTASGVTSINLRLMRQRTPTTVTLARLCINESDNAANGWRSFSLASSRTITKGEPIGLLVRCESGSPSLNVYYKVTGAPVSTGYLLSTNNNGGSWSASSGSVLHYELWGVYRTQEELPATVRAVSARVAVRTGRGVTEIHIALPNRPEVSP